MTQAEHTEGLTELQAVSARPVRGGWWGKLEQLGFFLLLLHKRRASRYWEIDALRGVAMVMMVIYHLVYDLVFFGFSDMGVVTGPWRVFARATASLFILLVGVSMAIGYARSSPQARGWNLYRTYLIRGLKLLGWGMVITLITWMYVGRVVIIFGILHLIGAVTILAYPFLSRRWITLAAGVATIGLGIHLNQLPVSQPWFLLLGLKPAALFQLDYFPLLPWFGVALLGVFFGQSLYPGGIRRFDLPDWTALPGSGGLVWLGNRSLAVYLTHQPALIALLTLAADA